MGNEQQQQGPSQQQPNPSTSGESVTANENASNGKTKKPFYKKAWFWIVVIVIILLIIGVSGGSDEEGTDSEETAAQDSVEVEEEDSEKADENSGKSKKSSKKSSGKKEEEKSKSVSLYDDNGITVDIVDSGEGFVGVYYTIEIVNDSEKNINVSIEDLSVDGTMVDIWFYEDVASGKNASEDLDIDEISSIDDLTNVEGTIDITDADTYDTIDSTTFTIK